jgi:DNA repair protein RadD
MSAELRPYQIDVIEKCRENVTAGLRRQIIVAPTGSGKTIIGSQIIKGAIAKGKRALVLAHTREIIAQTSDKLSPSAQRYSIARFWPST